MSGITEEDICFTANTRLSKPASYMTKLLLDFIILRLFIKQLLIDTAYYIV